MCGRDIAMVKLAMSILINSSVYWLSYKNSSLKSGYQISLLTSNIPLYKGTRSRKAVNSRILSSRPGAQSLAINETMYCE